MVSRDTNTCGVGWLDESEVGLGCILLEKTGQTFGEANDYCKNQNSILVEIGTKDQLHKLSNLLKKASGTFRYFWWGGAIQLRPEKDKNWIWQDSGTTVQDWVWGPNEPGTDSDVNHFMFDYRPSENESFWGGDTSFENIWFPVCQRPSVSGTGGDTGTEDLTRDTSVAAASSVPLIAGVSAGGLLLIAIVTIIIVWYLKDRNSSGVEIVEKNDQYGTREDYYDEYEKDDYNTKVTDNNYMYDGDMKDADEYDSDSD